MTSKALLAAVTSAFLLGACATGGESFSGLGSGTGIGSSVVKMAVDSQCRTELNKRNEWRVIALAMSAEKQAEWENKICGCASEEAPNQLTATEMMQVLSPGNPRAGHCFRYRKNGYRLLQTTLQIIVQTPFFTSSL